VIGINNQIDYQSFVNQQRLLQRRKIDTFPQTVQKSWRKKACKMAEEMKKEDRRVRRTRKILTQALTELLQQKQVNEITVKELTDLADMNRGTFYLYYKDIYDMLEKIQDEMFEKLDAIFRLRTGGDVTEQTKLILLDLFRFIEENQEVCRVLLSPNGDMSFLHRLNEVLREKCLHIYLGIEPSVNEEDFDYRYSFLIYGCAGIIRAWVGRNCPEKPEQMAELAHHLIVSGGFA
jgi:AcrR family transcriptional regulator